MTTWDRRPILLALGGLLFAGCGGGQERVTVTSEGRRASSAEVDEDAWRLLPTGAVAWWRSDARSLFASEFGLQLSRLLSQSLPFSEGAGVVPTKDIDLVVAGFYATVGSDLVAICKGRFKPDATIEAIRKNPRSAGGHPIVSVAFAGATMHVAGQVAMSILTDETLVFGTQLGVRRVLERVEEGRLKRELPSWFEALLETPGAEFQLGIDLDSQPIPASIGEKYAFLKGLRASRLVGNFRSPGLNLAGTLSYDTPAHAKSASAEIEGVKIKLQEWSLIMMALKIPQPLRRLESKPTGKDTQVVAELRGDSIARFLENAQKLFSGTDTGEWLPG